MQDDLRNNIEDLIFKYKKEVEDMEEKIRLKPGVSSYNIIGAKAQLLETIDHLENILILAE